MSPPESCTISLRVTVPCPASATQYIPSQHISRLLAASTPHHQRLVWPNIKHAATLPLYLNLDPSLRVCCVALLADPPKLAAAVDWPVCPGLSIVMQGRFSAPLPARLCRPLARQQDRTGAADRRQLGTTLSVHLHTVRWRASCDKVMTDSLQISRLPSPTVRHRTSEHVLHDI